MIRERVNFAFLNVGHFLDHLTTLVFATAAALALSREWGLSYAELIPYATPGFIAFGVFSLPAGWLADRWSREGMLAVFFVGLGLACIATSFATSPMQIAIGLFGLGVFAAIYHPVGLALLVQDRPNPGMAIAANGVFGNLGVGSAALATGYFIDHGGWRIAFIAPGLLSIAFGLAWTLFARREIMARNARPAKRATGAQDGVVLDRAMVIRLTTIIFLTSSMASLIFQSVSFSLPKVLDERLTDITTSATTIGWLAFLIFAVASIAQLVCGRMLDRVSARSVFLFFSALQVLFFAVMPELAGWSAIAVALGFMVGAFGQVPITDYLIGTMARGERRAQIYGARYVMTFLVIAAAIPIISLVYENWGFDRLFQMMSGGAALTFLAALFLPGRARQLGAAADKPAGAMAKAA